MLNLLIDPKETALRDAWRCDGCKRLIYNIDACGYPTYGAPLPAYINPDFPEVCSVCYEMHTTLKRIKSDYWKEPSKTNNIVRPDAYEAYS